MTDPGDSSQVRAELARAGNVVECSLIIQVLVSYTVVGPDLLVVFFLVGMPVKYSGFGREQTADGQRVPD
jgi:hypothetical protein